MKVLPAQYHRNSKNWHTILGKTGIVVFTTKLEVTNPELEEYLPYCFVVVQLSGSGEKIELMGEAHTLFQQGDLVRLELRKSATVDAVSILPYAIKAVKI